MSLMGPSFWALPFIVNLVNMPSAHPYALHESNNHGGFLQYIWARVTIYVQSSFIVCVFFLFFCFFEIAAKDIQSSDLHYLEIHEWKLCITFIKKIFSLYYMNQRTFTFHLKATNKNIACLDGWGCRMHLLHLCRGIKLPQQVSLIWN